VRFRGSNTGFLVIQPSATSATGTVLIPNGNDTVVLLAAIQTLTNKTINSATLDAPVFTNVATGATMAAVSYVTLTGNINSISSTAYTVANGDNGRTLIFTAGAAVAVSVTGGLTPGLNFNAIQSGTGQVTFSGTGGVTLSNRSGLKTAGQNAMVTIAYGGATNVYFVGGDTSV